MRAESGAHRQMRRLILFCRVASTLSISVVFMGLMLGNYVFSPVAIASAAAFASPQTGRGRNKLPSPATSHHPTNERCTSLPCSTYMNQHQCGSDPLASRHRMPVCVSAIRDMEVATDFSSSSRNYRNSRDMSPIEELIGIPNSLDSNQSSNNLSVDDSLGRGYGPETSSFAAADQIDRQTVYADLGEQELTSWTNVILSNSTIGQMRPCDLHEISRLMSTWSKRQVLKSGSMTEKLLLRIIDERDEGNIRAFPTVNHYNTAINAWTKCGAKDGARRASEILHLMESLHEKDADNAKPITKCLVSVLDGWCKSKLQGSVHMAEEVLERLGELPGNNRNVKHFNAVINAWAESGESDSGERAEQILNHMTNLYNAGETCARPNTRTYNTVIKAWAHSKKRGAAREAEKVLSSMHECFARGNMDAEPDKISFTLLLLAWAKSRERGSAARAEEILDHMEKLYNEGNRDVKPDTVTYNSVLNVCANSGLKDAGQRSERLLARMEYMFEIMGHDDLKPDSVSYNTVMNALANSAEPGAAQRAQNILQKMERLSKAGDLNARPDIVSYNSVMNAFAKSREIGAAQKAEEILERMENSYEAGETTVKPDSYSYNIVISAWSNSGDIFSAAKAELLLQRMKELYKTGDKSVKPDVTTYNSVLTAWSRTQERGAPQKAEAILEHMFDLYNAGDEAVKPDVQSFTTVINAWSKSKERNKARYAQGLLRRMERIYDGGDKRCAPNVYAYAAVLNACAYTFGSKDEKDEALDIAIRTFGELQKSRNARPNHVTYGTFLRVCRRLIPDSDNRKKPLVESVFRQCCKEGQVGESVLSQIYGAAAPELYIELLGEEYGKGVMTIDDIPPEWTCNVREKMNCRVSRRHHGKIRGRWHARRKYL